MSRKNRRARLSLEALEGRLTPTATWSPTTGILNVQGTSGDDNVQVSTPYNSWYTTYPYGQYLQVTESGTTTRWSISDPSVVRQIRFTGGEGNDRFISSALASVYAEGGRGNDYLQATAFTANGVTYNDVLIGGDDMDVLYSDRGTDQLDGGPGDDRLQASAQSTFDGGSGLTIINSEIRIQGTAGVDTVTVTQDAGGNVVVDHNGTRTTYPKALLDTRARLFTTGQDSIVFDGGPGNDVFTNDTYRPCIARGGPGHDTLIGGHGGDVLYGGTGADVLDGRAGVDYLYGVDATVQTYGFTGSEAAGGSDAEPGFTPDLDAAYNTNVVNQLFGGDGDDLLHGGSANDNLTGGHGMDQLYGFGGQDLLHGDGVSTTPAVRPPGYDPARQPGNDSMYGGVGNDGFDGGPGSDFMRGNAGDDVMLGGDGNDSMFGDSGNDVLNGGAGDDWMYAGTSERVGDLIPGRSGSAYSDWYHNSLVGGAGNDRMYGAEGPDVMVGGDTAAGLAGLPDGNDFLYGYGGNDLLEGGAGDDFLAGGDHFDILVGQGGNDTLYANDVGIYRDPATESFPDAWKANAPRNFFTSRDGTHERVCERLFGDYALDYLNNWLPDASGKTDNLGADFLYGTEGSDVLVNDSNDTVDGKGGIDRRTSY